MPRACDAHAGHPLSRIAGDGQPSGADDYWIVAFADDDNRALYEPAIEPDLTLFEHLESIALACGR